MEKNENAKIASICDKIVQTGADLTIEWGGEKDAINFAVFLDSKENTGYSEDLLFVLRAIGERMKHNVLPENCYENGLLKYNKIDKCLEGFREIATRGKETLQGSFEFEIPKHLEISTLDLTISYEEELEVTAKITETRLSDPEALVYIENKLQKAITANLLPAIKSLNDLAYVWQKLSIVDTDLERGAISNKFKLPNLKYDFYREQREVLNIKLKDPIRKRLKL